jgi:hypothetical protein
MTKRIVSLIGVAGAALALVMAPQLSSGTEAQPGSTLSPGPTDVGAPLVDGRVQSECGGPRAQIAVIIGVESERTTLQTEVIRARPGSRWVLFAAFRRGADVLPRQVRITASPDGRVEHTFSFHTHGDGLVVTARRVSDDLHCYVALHNR